MPTMSELFTSKGCIILCNSQRLQSQLTSFEIPDYINTTKIGNYRKKQNHKVSNRYQSNQEYHKHLDYFRKADCELPNYNN